MRAREKLAQITRQVTNWMGTPSAMYLNCSVVIFWLITGLIVGFSDTHQLLINTGTTIWTYLSIPVLQNDQNRNSRALHLKLDELLLTQRSARNELISLERAEDKKIDQIAESFNDIRNDEA